MNGDLPVQKRPPSTLPRIWWCPTGPLAFLPIHAAGVYQTDGHFETTSSFAVSSYIPTISTLSDKMKQKVQPTSKHLLLVSQVDAPDLPRIPGADEETKRLLEFLEGTGNNSLRLSGPDARISKVMAEMTSYSSIHLACHGQQEVGSPLKSGFYLGDGPLELSEIMKHLIPNADFAFLSACQTSTGDEALSEEVVHLAAGMLAAGYRSVVSTMWSIDDAFGPEIAQGFYQQLQTADGRCARLDGARAAYALHEATKTLRQKVGTTEKGLLIWAPYVHFGI